MAEFIAVSDPGDPRLGDYVSLRDSSLRKSLEAERGLFIAEGDLVIRRAITAGYRPRSLLLAERWLAGLDDLLAPLDVPVYVVTEQLAEAVTGFHVHRGALAALHRVARHSVADILAMDRVVVAEDIVDHTNVGAIIRNAAGLGWGGMLISPRCADPLYRRAVKVSMGAVFSLPWARLDDWAGAVPLLQAAGFTVAALALRADGVDIGDLSEIPAKLAILLGTEGAGLSERWISQADLVVRIPMHAGIDSLNVAAASAIACYALSAAPC
ncbi:MAG: RNA methyltransferase [Propionibacteriaceae bacterium]|jgi:tRNA G18 (ribose-2'-O)-methylase SpoU|nr:RNA methyltransferase [Propionibacteriaceae bacterium]